MKRRDYMVALALVGAMMTGCSGGDDSIADTPQQPLNTSKTVTLKTTVGLDGGADTYDKLRDGFYSVGGSGGGG
ncbi:MAG: hypothetical protein IJ929_00345, partial [Prevotella sp.]|nr:hypothetical protein [Prevotella sp.]